MAICQELNTIYWDNMTTKWIIFRNLVLSLVEKYVSKAAKKAETNKPPWWSNQLTQVIKEKQNLYSQYKFTWSLVWIYEKVRSKISQLEKKNGTLTVNDKETVEVLNTYCKSVEQYDFPTKVNSVLDDIVISEFDVYDIFELPIPNKAPGPDNLHPQVLKNSARSLTKPLLILFTCSLNSGILPNEWEKANITPIFKKAPNLYKQL